MRMSVDLYMYIYINMNGGLLAYPQIFLNLTHNVIPNVCQYTVYRNIDSRCTRRRANSHTQHTHGETRMHVLAKRMLISLVLFPFKTAHSWLPVNSF